jgi:hypothetical protein
MIEIFNAGNFRFGHSYGYLDANSLWNFEDWISYEASEYQLTGGGAAPIEINLNWEGSLPYPEGENYLGDESPVCTTYPPEDLNFDCEVNFKDMAVLGNAWLTEAP